VVEKAIVENKAAEIPKISRIKKKNITDVAAKTTTG